MFLFLTLVFTCFALTGLIWTIQLVHYPSFMWVEKNDFVSFEKFHSARISIIVMPLMLLELGLSSYFIIKPDTGFDFLFDINFIGVILIWLSTFLLSVPCHSKLNLGFNQQSINKLVSSNWPRAMLWSARSVILFYILNQLITSGVTK